MGEEVTLIGSGEQRPGQPYRFIHAGAIGRERFERMPKLPLLRGDTAWEELTFLPGLLKAYNPEDFDVTLTCSYPFTNWALRRPAVKGGRPAHLFVTQNGDWPAYDQRAEFRFFGCDGLVCINPDYQARNEARYRCALIPNGVDRERFTPGASEPERFGLDPTRPVVLMVSAMIASKNIGRGIEAVSRLPDAQLVVAGDGPLRGELQEQAGRSLPGRFHQLRVAPADMPALYRSADAFLHLSRDESFGNVYVEAMACGTPVVAYDLPRTRWIVGDDAFLSGEDPAQLATTIEEAVGAGDQRREALVRRSEAFSWPVIARAYRNFIKEVVSATRNRAVDERSAI